MTKPHDDDVARFQAQLALALLKRQLNSADHLSAEQLAQLLSHRAPPDLATQWKQHLNDCNDCYSVFLDVAQAQLQNSDAAAPAKTLLHLEFSRWRYALGFGLPVVLVAVLYFSWPQQQWLQTAKEQSVLSDTPIEFDRAASAPAAEPPAKPRAVLSDPIQEQEVALSSPPVLGESLADATPTSVVSADVKPSPDVSKQASAELLAVQNPLISAAANERRVKVASASHQNEKAGVITEFAEKRDISALDKNKSVSAPASVAQTMPLGLSKAAERPATTIESSDAEAIEVIGARVSSADDLCGECNADEKFAYALEKWAENVQQKCDKKELNLIQTREQWRQLLNRHSSTKRDELLKTVEPNKVDGWCELAKKTLDDLSQ